MSDGSKRWTPAAAVARGQWMVNGPVALAMFGPAALVAAGGWLIGYAEEGFAIAVLVFFPSVIAAWIVWSVRVPLWRIWAYARVNDLDELKARAVEAGLIWPEGHWFEKTEIRSRRMRETLNRLEFREGSDPST